MEDYATTDTLEKSPNQLDDVELDEAIKDAEQWLTIIRDKIRANRLPLESKSLAHAESHYAELITVWQNRQTTMR